MAQRNPYYDSVLIAYIERMLNNGEYDSIKKIAEKVGISSATLVASLRRLISSGRLSATREHAGRRFEYKILIPPTDHDRLALDFQLKLKGTI